MSVMSRATEIRRLVRQLGSRRDSVVEASRVRLCAQGPRAVGALIEALEGGSPRVRAQAIPVLGLIQDPRGREPIAAMLLDRDPRLRELAARALAWFPSTQAVAALEVLVRRERSPEVRIAAVQAMLEQYASGQEGALGGVLGLLFDPSEDERVRVAATALVPMLRPQSRRGILGRLRRDPAPAVVRRVRELESQPDRPRARGATAVRRLARSLAGDDHAAWSEALRRLAAGGAASVEPLLAEMRRRAHDPEYCARAGVVLKAIGPRAARAIAAALDRVREPVPLKVLVEIIGALGDKALVYRLRDVIARISADAGGSGDRNGFDPLQRVRAMAHLELARIGSRVAVDDLHRILSDPGRRLESEIPAALELIGARDELPGLLLAYSREDRFLRQRIGEAVRAIMRRERIRRRDAIFRSMSGRQRRAVESIVPRSRPRHRAEGRRAGACR